MTETQRVEALSNWYLNDQLDFDKRLVEFRYAAIREHFVGRTGLELGPAEGVMTRLLLQDFESLTVVDGSQTLLAKIPDSYNLSKVHSIFENYEPQQQFDTIILEHVLEHVDDPTSLLSRVKNWLAPKGRLVIGVPNGNSIHRLVAVKMGLLTNKCDLNERDIALGHRRVYLRDSLNADISAAGLETLFFGGVYFKPVSNGQIEQHWSEAMIQGFFELGKDFPEVCAELFAVCRSKD